MSRWKALAWPRVGHRQRVPRLHFGDYQIAFLVGGCLGLIAACLALMVRATDRSDVQLTATPELASV